MCHPRRRGETKAAHYELAEAAKERIVEMLARPLSLNELAAELRVSPSHLARVFRSETGFALHQYRKQLRLRIALDRLREGARSLTSLALELGFASHSHFTDAFRAEFALRRPRSATHASPPRCSLRDRRSPRSGSGPGMCAGTEAAARTRSPPSSAAPCSWSGSRAQICSDSSVTVHDGTEWRQAWVDANHTYLDFRGGPVADELHLVHSDGNRRMRFTEIGTDSLVWLWERRDGEQWELVWRIDYARNGS